MNKRYFVPALLAASIAVGAIGNASAQEATRISQANAEHIALAKVPGGKIKSAELEHEKGAQVWSFDIAKPGTRDITEVLVNAQTGAIVDISTESPLQQQEEAEEDRHEQRGKH